MKLPVCTARPWRRAAWRLVAAALLAGALGGCAANGRQRSTNGGGSWFRKELQPARTMGEFLSLPRPGY